ncbi:class IIb bacteriocin, lactobin A/cerein 7B family [Algoriphagus marinus]|uniref:class IIb bacteriocin, lactobin A/cerein 7B family n=1 Tax=Algoriphagus marinus TaxID=1925762 RepID=UPI00094B86AF|nr:class IIb bacteriocin, lactobin A/cerein 7B family [Algoriphagus marinus]
MRELSIEQMEMVNGGAMNDATRCIGGILATAALGATAFFAPVAFMGVLSNPVGLEVVAGVSAAAAIAIYEGC